MDIVSIWPHRNDSCRFACNCGWLLIVSVEAVPAVMSGKGKGKQPAKRMKHTPPSELVTSAHLSQVSNTSSLLFD